LGKTKAITHLHTLQQQPCMAQAMTKIADEKSLIFELLNLDAF
jgi:hypothetical protein